MLAKFFSFVCSIDTELSGVAYTYKTYCFEVVGTLKSINKFFDLPVYLEYNNYK